MQRKLGGHTEKEDRRISMGAMSSRKGVTSSSHRPAYEGLNESDPETLAANIDGGAAPYRRQRLIVKVMDERSRFIGAGQT